MVYAIATTASPNASDVPTTVDANAGLLDVHPRLTATPHPISTSTMVPSISAKYFFIVVKDRCLAGLFRYMAHLLCMCYAKIHFFLSMSRMAVGFCKKIFCSVTGGNVIVIFIHSS